MDQTSTISSVSTGGGVELSATELKERLHRLETEVKTFGQKRAYFMDIYKRKEEEANDLEKQLKSLKHVNARLESDLKGLRDQVGDMKTEHMITCLSKDEELERLKLMHQEDLSSLNMSMQEMLNDSADRQQLQELVDKLSTENVSLRDQLGVIKLSLQGKVEKEQNMARQLARPCSSEKCAEERQWMKMQLDKSHERLQQYADRQELDEEVESNEEMEDSAELNAPRKARDLFEVVDQEERIKDLENELKNEKSNRSDLEMYVAVMAKQKDVFHADVDAIRKELGESLALLDKEKKEHNNLKITWQMANDQFLEAQRLLMIDMKRLESVLTEEQQRRVAELQKQDEEREAQQKKVKELERQRNEQMMKMEAEADSMLDVPDTLRLSPSQSSLSSADIYGDFERAEPIDLETADSPSPSASVERDPQATPAAAEMQSISVRNVLTKDMQTALVAPRPEDVENKKVLDQLKASTPDRGMSPAGSRVVSEKQWHKLQEELQSSRAKLGRPCDMCKNYELEMQKEQERIKALDSQLSQSRQNFKMQKKTIEELESTLRTLGEENQGMLKEMESRAQQSEEQLYVMNENLVEIESSFRHQLTALSKERMDAQKKLVELEKENEQLMDLRSKVSQELLDEQFSPPNDLSEAQAKLSEFREQLIQAKTAREHMDRKLRAEIRLLKDQAVAVECEYKSKEDMLSQEISELQDRNVKLASVESEMTRESKLREEMEEKVRKMEEGIKSHHTTETQLKQQVQQLLSDLDAVKSRNVQLKDQLMTLQQELTNSESVQKDFVKLSQQLQIQLEKIRQAETEVRWQHEDDVSQCNNCGKELSTSRDKLHCMHCGKVHCQECSSRVVMAGPSRRPTRVCDVCHTILVSDAMPYFSSEAKLKS